MPENPMASFVESPVSFGMFVQIISTALIIRAHQNGMARFGLRLQTDNPELLIRWAPRIAQHSRGKFVDQRQ
jgi:hypothetical protein